MQATPANPQAFDIAGRPFQWKTYAGLDHGLSFDVWQDMGAWLGERTSR